MEDPQYGCFPMENPIKMDDLGVSPFQETFISTYQKQKYINTLETTGSQQFLDHWLLRGACFVLPAGSCSRGEDAI